MSGPDVSVEVTMPPGSVIITPTQVYGEVQQLTSEVRQLTAVIDPALNTIREHVKDHEGRLRAVEKRLWLIGGAATAAGAGLSQLLPLLAR